MEEGGGGEGGGGARDTESKTRTPHKDVGNNGDVTVKNDDKTTRTWEWK